MIVLWVPSPALVLFVMLAQSMNMQALVNVNVILVVLDLNPMLIKVLVNLVLLELILMVMEDAKTVQRENILLLWVQSNVTIVAVVVKRQVTEPNVSTVLLVNSPLKEEVVKNAKTEPTPLMLVLVNATNALLVLNPVPISLLVLLVSLVLILLMDLLVKDVLQVNIHLNMERQFVVNVHVVMKKTPHRLLVIHALLVATLPTLELANPVLSIPIPLILDLVLVMSVEQELK